jgi:hypothetical protein
VPYLKSVRKFLFLLIAITGSVAHADGDTWLIPVFAEAVPGANGSLWQSEIRFYNFASGRETVTFIRVLPSQGTICNSPASIELPPGGSQVRSIGCDSGGFAAVEISASPSVRIDSVLTNTSALRESCCLPGLSTTVPVLRSDGAYGKAGAIPNVGVSADINRANLIVVNPGEREDILVRVFASPSVVSAARVIAIPANSIIQFNVFPQFFSEELLPPSGYFAVSVGPALIGQPSFPRPIFALVSVVDNHTNDSTILAWSPGASVLQ